MKKIIASVLCLCCLVGCGSHDEAVRLIEDEYSVLDYNTLKIEHDLLGQMVEEQEKSLMAVNALSFATGVISVLATGSGRFTSAGSEQLNKDKLRLEALANLIDEGPKHPIVPSMTSSTQAPKKI